MHIVPSLTEGLRPLLYFYFKLSTVALQVAFLLLFIPKLYSKIRNVDIFSGQNISTLVHKPSPGVDNKLTMELISLAFLTVHCNITYLTVHCNITYTYLTVHCNITYTYLTVHCNITIHI